MQLPEWWSSPLVARLVDASVGVAVVLIFAAIARAAARRTLADNDVRYRVRKLVDMTSYLVVALVVLTSMSNELSGLSFAMGGISVGVGLALQEVVISFAGWLAISAGNFYRVGERIQLGGITGDVIDIGILRTTLMETGAWVKGDLYNGRVVRVANSFVFREPVFNYSADFPFLWDEITVPVKYGSDHGLARRLLDEVSTRVTETATRDARETWPKMVRSYRIEDARVEPLVTLVANDNWLEFTVRYVTHHRTRRTTKDQLFQGILDAIDGTGGKVRLASMTVELVEIPPLRIQQGPQETP
ncbi:MAG: mechanosensitive ion channel [Alphaproteobacteria bacterium]|nr:mechanosensitive ion channel [Alphaproteobacteria bacterium]MCB9698385.1 mechanosensitive ion channel [Alphaproteobacteria bacterium]